LAVPRPGKGICGGAKIFGSASAQCLRLFWAFFIIIDIFTPEQLLTRDIDMGFLFLCP